MLTLTVLTLTVLTLTVLTLTALILAALISLSRSMHPHCSHSQGFDTELADPERAVTTFAAAVKAGSVPAQRHLGMCYADGRGVDKDIEMAKMLLLEAAEKGCPPSGNLTLLPRLSYLWWCAGLTYPQCIEVFCACENAFSVGWMDGQAAQWTRFKSLLDGSPSVGPDDSLLDLGCGLGHLIDYCKEVDRVVGAYTGYDPHEAVVQRAKIRHPQHTFVVGDIFCSDETFDWVLMSGIFNIGVTAEEMYSTLVEACGRATKGVMFNALTAPYEHEEYAAYNPVGLIAELEDRLARNGKTCSFHLLEDYGVDDEFTIYAYRDTAYHSIRIY